MLGRRLRRIGATVVVVVGAAVIVALATGEVTLVTTHGVSMLPRFHTGDVAIIIPSAQYRVGDIVGYHSPLLHITVLHRIVAEHAGLFAFKGDHNSFRDPVALRASAIRGRLWLRLPHFGTVLGWFRTPIGLSLLAFLFMVLGLVGGVSQRHRALRKMAVPQAGVMGKSLGHSSAAGGGVPLPWWPVAVLLALAGIFGPLAAVSWARPVTRASERPLAYNQHIKFSYSGSAPTGVTYPTGSVVTGDPVFLRLVSTLTVRAQYAFDASAPGPSTASTTDVWGTIGAKAVLQGPGGWHGQLAMVAPVRFSGSTASVNLAISLSQITALETAFNNETGLSLGTTNISVTPTVRIHGVLDGARVVDFFAPPLSLQLSGEALSLVSSSSSGGTSAFPQLTPTHSGSVDRSVRVPEQMSILGRSIDVLAARRLSLGGLVVLIAGVIAEILWLLRRRRMDEAARISAAYRQELVAVSASPANSAQLVVDVETFGELAHLARRYDCVILEHAHLGGHAYYVESGATIYRCGVEASADPIGGRIQDPAFAGAMSTRGIEEENGAAVMGEHSSDVDTLTGAADGPSVFGPLPRAPRRGLRPSPRLEPDAAKAVGDVDLLTRLAKAEWVSGVGDAKAHLHSAVALAKKSGLDQEMIEALLVNVRPAFNAGQESDPEKIELLQYCLGLDIGPALRARILGALAVELIFVGDTEYRSEILDEARETARRSCDPQALVETSACHFLARPRSNWATCQLELDRTVFVEALDRAVTLDDPIWLATVQACAASYAVMAGDGEAIRAHVDSLLKTSAGGQNQIALRARLLFAQTIATFDGRLGDAAELSIEADDVGRSARLADDSTEALQRVLALRREQDRLEEIAPVVTDQLTAHPRRTAWDAVLTFLLAETGQHHEVAVRLRSASRTGMWEMTDDDDWPLAMAMWSEAAVRIADREAAAILHQILRPHDGVQMWTNGVPTGPVARLLALLEHVLGRTEEADRHFAEAVEFSRRLMSPVWTARCQLDWAETWLVRGEIAQTVQLIYAADATMEMLELPALRRQSANLRNRLNSP